MFWDCGSAVFWDRGSAVFWDRWGAVFWDRWGAVFWDRWGAVFWDCAGNKIVVVEVNTLFFLGQLLDVWKSEAEESPWLIYLLVLRDNAFYSELAAVAGSMYHYVVSPFVTEGLHDGAGLTVDTSTAAAFALDTLEAAVVCRQSDAYGKPPFNKCLADTTFEGYTGPVSMQSYGLRAGQRFRMWNYDAAGRVTTYYEAADGAVRNATWGARDPSDGGLPVGGNRDLDLLVLDDRQAQSGALIASCGRVVEQLNNSSGTLFAEYGKRLRLTVVDADRVASASTRTVGCLGPVDPDVAMRLVPVVQHVYGVPVVSSASVDTLTGGSFPFFVRITASCSQVARATAHGEAGGGGGQLWSAIFCNFLQFRNFRNFPQFPAIFSQCF